MMDYVLIYILALVANFQTGVVTLTALKGKYGMLFGGYLLGIVWIVGSIRLAKPESVWARTFYGPDELGESVRRFSIKPGGPWPYPAPPAAAPIQITRGVLLAIAAGLAGAVAVLNLGMFLVGPLLPFAALARRGVRWARTTTVALVAVMTVSGFALAARVAPEPDPVHITATGLQVLLTVGAWHQLYRGEARHYFHRVGVEPAASS